MLDIDQTAGTQTDRRARRRCSRRRKQRINFQIAGRGRYTYQCILGGFVPADKLQEHDATTGTSSGPTSRRRWRSTAARSRAASACCKAATRRSSNPLTQLPVGRRGHGRAGDLAQQRARQHARGAAGVPRRHRADPQRRDGDREVGPRAGSSGSRSRPGAITFYVGSRRSTSARSATSCTAICRASTAPARRSIRNAYRPEQLAVADAEVAGRAAAGRARAPTRTGSRRRSSSSWASATSTRRTTEDGRRAPDRAGRRSGTSTPTSTSRRCRCCWTSTWRLGPPAKVVRYFEIIKEKWPAEEIPFAKIVKVGAAYHEMGEYERSYLVFRATVESSFAPRERRGRLPRSAGRVRSAAST